MRALILEDNEERRSTMADILGDLLPSLAVEFFLTSQDMIQQINKLGLFDVALISLDNDLDPIKSPNGDLLDAGDGIQVAQYLTTVSPVAPVIVHTTNTAAGDQITETLLQCDWHVSRVVPYSDLQWICEIWRSTVRELLVSFSPTSNLSELGVRIVNQGLRTQNFDACLSELLRATAYCACAKMSTNDFRVELAITERNSFYCDSSVNSKKLLDEIQFRQEIADFAVENACDTAVGFKSNHRNLTPYLQKQLSECGAAQLYTLQWNGPADCQTQLLFLTSDSSVDLASRLFADIAREARMVLQLAVSSQRRCLPVQPIVYSDPSTAQVWPSPIQERKE